NMINIIDEIVRSERCLLNVALILYRDHPPQEMSFIIQVNDFTDDKDQAKSFIDSASAAGGGDLPEAIAPALDAAVNVLSWRKNSVKIALLIADAPPHGLLTYGDTWPLGDPSGCDPMNTVALMAEKSITLYSVGCEPAVSSYRDFFMAIAFKTGGQYIPLDHAGNLAAVIIGSAQEEISLEKLMAQVHEEVMKEAAARGGPVDEIELTRRIQDLLKNGGTKTKRLKIDNNAIPSITTKAEQLSKMTTMQEVRDNWTSTGFTTSTMTTAMIPKGRGKPRKASCITTTTIATAKTASSDYEPKVTTTTPPTTTTTRSKRKVAETITSVKKKKPSAESSAGKRRSTRLAFNNPEDAEKYIDETGGDTETSEEEEETDKKDVASPPKPTKLIKKLSSVHLDEDELLDISQTRRLVRKSVARNKLKSK
ncbi:unnamed protein product, partial [Didymodactylos carnosus]